MGWLLKTGDDEYFEWSHVCDEVSDGPMTRAEAVVASSEERVAFTDKHLCSCLARLGEQHQVRNGRLVATGGGRLAYHFDSYAEVRDYMDRVDR